MNSGTLVIATALPANGFDDDIFALTLHLEELRIEDALDDGKYPEGQPPDATLALKEYQTEIATYLQGLTDLKLAHSIARAVDTDAPAIADLISNEVQAEDDRRTAIQISTENPELESPAAPPPYEETEPTRSFMLMQKQYFSALQWDISSVFGDDLTTEASKDNFDKESPALESPQVYSYTNRQKAALMYAA